MLKKVVLPAPFGPIKLQIERSGRVKSTLLTATRPPKRLVMPRASSNVVRLANGESMAGLIGESNPLAGGCGAALIARLPLRGAPPLDLALRLPDCRFRWSRLAAARP